MPCYAGHFAFHGAKGGFYFGMQREGFVPNRDEFSAEWRQLTDEIAHCRACGLCESRRNAVVGRGSLAASVLFVGEGPGENEDIEGLPFVGKAGKLLDLALEGLAYDPASYYIANVVKCRPPSNRAPGDDEASACLPFLRRQLRLINPRIIVCLGAVAMRHIVGKEFKITKIRGGWIERGRWLIMPTFHPAALLRDVNKKAPFWQDLKNVKQAADNAARGNLVQPG
jgi:DNA polymerase